MAAAFTQVFHRAIRRLSKELSLSEMGLLWMLTAYIGRSDTMLRDEHGLPLTSARIAELAGLSRQHANRMLRHLVEVGALQEHPVGNARCFAFNTGVAHRYGAKHIVSKKQVVFERPS